MGQVDRDAMVEGVQRWYNKYNERLPLADAIKKWSEHFEVKEKTIKKHLRESSRIKCNTTHILLTEEARK